MRIRKDVGMGCETSGVLQSQLIGIVYDSVTNLPISEAIISSPCWLDITVRSQIDGTFVFPATTEGIYDYAVSKDGYSDKEYVDVALLPTVTKYLEVPMTPIAMSVSGDVSIASENTELSGCVVTKVKLSLWRNNTVDQSISSNDGTFAFGIQKAGIVSITAEKTVAGVTYKGATNGIDIKQGQSISGIQLIMQKQ